MAHDASGSFPGQPPLGPTIDLPPLLEGPGSRIGKYKLLQQIGEGGMGVVFMAEQLEPVTRKVALKIIKPGMDTQQIIARFEAERQALALMDHPNIARVLDAGSTDTGLPYFVMELVRGVPITQFCDERRLTPPERLALFVLVCQAVQHAHHKGIIHRDLKASNVMIALYDGRPVPKVIDFGVAKASGQKLTDKTLFTGFGAVVGTLEYMSPEQAELNQLDIDTRSDIYALGVLLYELLTGTTPHPRQQLREAALWEGLRIIREVEPPRPSLRLSTTDKLASIAAERGVEAKKLSGLVRGDLDWLVMKCLEKDRNRRYETANALALDVQRYLADEPVLASPPSTAYRLRKFLGRHRRQLVTAGLIVLVVLASAGGLAWVLWDRSVQQAHERAGLEQAVNAALDKARDLRQQSRWAEVRAVLEQTRDRLGTGGTEELRQRVQLALADWALVDRLQDIRLRRSSLVESVLDSQTAEKEYADAFRNAGLGMESNAAEMVAARVLGTTVADDLLAAVDDWAAITENEPRRTWLLAVARGVDPDPWRDRFRDPRVVESRIELLDLAKELLDDDKLLAGQKPQLLNALATALALRQGHGASLLLAARQRFPDDFWLRFSLGRALCRENSLDEAIGILRTTVAVHKSVAAVHNSLGEALRRKKQEDDAIKEFRLAMELDGKFAWPHYHLAILLEGRGQLDAAIAEYRRAVELDPRIIRAYKNLARALQQQLHCTAAVRVYREAFANNATLADDVYRPENDYGHRDYRQTRYNAARLAALAADGQGNDAAALDGQERSQLRQQALAWLRAELGWWDRHLPIDKAGVRTALRRWQTDPDLASIRDSAALAKLPGAEREACQHLWQELAALSAKASEWLVLVAGGPKIADGISASEVGVSATGINFDRAGNLYVADFPGHRVRKIDVRGIITTIAGTGVKGFGGDGGPATNAMLDSPHSLVVTPKGDILVADMRNYRVRKIDVTTGIITTIAGSGVAGFGGDGGPAVRARFDKILGLALDVKGEKLFLADGWDNRRIRMVDLASGIISTVAGNGATGVPKDGELATKSPLVFPRDVVLDSSGNLYIADQKGHALRVVDVHGRIHTVAGTGGQGETGDGGPARDATLTRPVCLCLDGDGNVLIAGIRRVRKYLPKDGRIFHVAGTENPGSAGLNGPPELAQLSTPQGVAVHPSGTIYIADTANSRIVKIEPDPGVKRRW